jgi:DNA primase
MPTRIKIKPEQIERWVKRNFPEAKLRGRKQISINNPFNGDSGNHFWISLQANRTKRHDRQDYYAHDWRNNSYNMSFLTFVKRYLNVSYFEAIRDVTQSSKSNLRELLRSRKKQEEIEEENQIEEQVELPVTSKPFKEEDTKISKMALRYLKSRGISKEQAIGFNLYYTPTSIVFPYIEYGVMVYWQERSLVGKSFDFPSEEKTGLNKSDYLFNFDNVEQPDSTVIIVESIINAINVGEGCVATGGAAVSDNSKQLDKICGFEPRQVIFAPDYDGAGLRSALNNYLLLKKRIGAQFGLVLPYEKGLDWNDIEMKDGEGSARKYVFSNTMKFDLRYLMRIIDSAV